MSLIMDIGTGSGLAGATGVRPYLPPLLVGGLARADTGIDFDGTDFSFLESTIFLAAVLALALAAYALERAQAPAAGESSGRSPIELFSGLAGIVLGALLFAGALADGGEASWIGLVAGPFCAALGWLSIGGLVERARRRLDSGAAALVTLYADAVALALAALAVFVPPVSFLALIAFVVLLLGGRRREGEKYAGLRILR
jgi:Domain of unknown function (DUF4126)